ncbi:MAG: energy-coupling factor ABC transporter ATP-binding protein [Alphaproteobacteria bacterium]|nr:energy-coupling factor ABC transporter ATP-binding protein [Alphaproteobacteria bacterium]MBU1278411.1 energy-coupling factor ABC transporter ATP-binding protein [Alphaproteobacteria bacterium]MBU1574849.1 energy-coupling factor ABC transporter ATP-binding protein [Alphaproteobacteria bacterium]MBU1828841.1 energy-coupling factor ABC transporter ATP-binding protein [Alphaproteobacteria bacterium]MBU2080188.1 energy-coupling factor ABC transporter ATP-binding protein [Alphaproteobacteria bact
MIQFDRVTVAKEGRTILSEISLDLPEHRIGVIGNNGSGKSTFLRLFNGLERPTTGRVCYKGEDKTDLRQHVGFVFQNPDNQIVFPMVDEDLAFGLKARKLSKPEIKTRIDAVLTELSLTHLRERLTHQLSGGEKQMVALAGVLITRPDLIVFDEPTTLLDLRNKLRFMSVLDALPHPAVVVSHDLDLLAGFDRILHIEDGHIIADGAPDVVIPAYIARSTC